MPEKAIYLACAGVKGEQKDGGVEERVQVSQKSQEQSSETEEADYITIDPSLIGAQASVTVWTRPSHCATINHGNGASKHSSPPSEAVTPRTQAHAMSPTT